MTSSSLEMPLYGLHPLLLFNLWQDGKKGIREMGEDGHTLLTRSGLLSLGS